MCLITKKGANQKTLLVCSELTLLARSSCSLRAEDVGKQYMLQRKITSVHSMGNKSVPLADSPRPGWEGVGHLRRTSRWLSWWCQWTQAADKVGEKKQSATRVVDKAKHCHFVPSLVHKGTGHQLSSWIFRYLQRSTTDQKTINIGLCRQLFAVCTSHRACTKKTVNTHVPRWRSSRSIFIGQLLKKCIPP